MTEELQTTGQTGETAPIEPSGNAQRTFTQAELDSIIKERLQKERHKYADYDTLKEKASRYDQHEQAQLSEVEKLQKQLETYKSVEAEVKALKEQLQAVTERDTKRLEGLLTKVPEHLHLPIKAMSVSDALQYLEENLDRLSKPVAPDLEGGVQGVKRGGVKPTKEQLGIKLSL